MSYGKVSQRLIHYPKDGHFETNEIEAIQTFKDFCKKKGIKYPDRDNEILRFMHAKQFKANLAYDALITKIKYLDDKLPIMVNNNVFNLINSGMLYIQGRDRHFRPILVLRPSVIFKMNPLPTNDDLIAATCIIMTYGNCHMC